MVKRCIALIFVVVLVFHQLPTAAYAQTAATAEDPATDGPDRVALVIGNNDYHHIADLANPINDAEGLGRKLDELGFTVFLGVDQDLFSLADLINAFLNQIKPGSDVVVFFAGHGLEVRGSNYLLPVDIPALNADSERQLRHRAINLTSLLLDLEASQARVSLVILDSCRENPFPAMGTRSLGSAYGMGDIGTPPDGLFVVYSAGANQLALDNLGENDTDPNSLFTRHFLKLLDEPQLDIRDMVLRLRTTVREQALTVNHRQTPAYYDQLIGEFRLNLSKRPSAQTSGLATQDTATNAKTQTAALASPSAISIRNPAEEACFLDATRQFGLSISTRNRRYDEFIRLFEECMKKTLSGKLPPSANVAINNCDRLAASPDDPMRPETVAGVPFAALKGAQALLACQKAIADQPDIARFKFQLGRAFEALGRTAEALETFNQAAISGSTAAIYNLGVMYLGGTGISPDHSTAKAYLTQAAKLGHSDAMVELGMMRHRGQAPDMTATDEFHWYRKAAELGNRAAINNIGVMYRSGQGVNTNPQEAVTWFLRAANLGFPRAMKNLADLYLNGEGVPQDTPEAIKWYQLAAERGIADAMVELGLIHENGRGIPKDFAKARHWYSKAAALGDSYGALNLGVLHRDGKGVTKDIETALSWFLNSAAAGNKFGMFNAAQLYQLGDGIPQNYTKAMEYYRKAADNDHSEAMVEIGLMIYNNQGVDNDPKEEIAWYERAAALGNAAAMNNLGIMYREGEGVTQDYTAARNWFQKSADADFSDAMFHLAEYYTVERYKDQNFEIAAFWMERSLRGGSERALKALTNNARDWPLGFRKTFQQRLQNAGVYTGAIEGQFGKKTLSAVNQLYAQGV